MKFSKNIDFFYSKYNLLRKRYLDKGLKRRN